MTLKTEVENGYIDKYPKESTWTSYSNRILGDATGEMGPFYYYYDKDYNNGTQHYHNVWYADHSIFVASTGYPWFIRGGYYGDGILAGQFRFDHHTGVESNYVSFRIVLSPTN